MSKRRTGVEEAVVVSGYVGGLLVIVVVMPYAASAVVSGNQERMSLVRLRAPGGRVELLREWLR